MSRFAYIILAYAAAMLIGCASFFDPQPRLLWNTTKSAPTGLYVLRRAGSLNVGDLVAVEPPEQLALFLARRHYLPLNVPLLKHVGAVSGQEVCRSGRQITIEGRTVADALSRDRFGRPLPVWNGCRRLRPGEVFLLNRDVRDSLDGRYFGPLPANTILGQATPIWTDPQRLDRAATH